MIVLHENRVKYFRLQRQMLTPDTKGRGPAGTLAALHIVQPALQGNRWLTARVATPDDHRGELAAEGKIVEARLFRNTLGTVLREDLGLYLDACGEESYPPLSNTATVILSLFNEAENLTTDAIQEGAHLSHAQVRKALVELGRNQLVVESLKDTWWLTQSLVLRARQGEDRRLAARGEVISRFLANYGPATLLELANWSGWSRRSVQASIDWLCSEGTVVGCQLNNTPQTHFVRQTDIEEIRRTQPVDHSLVFLACYDPVVRAQQAELQERYGYGCSITAFWHYLLVDGEWCGALHIHYKMKMLWIRDLLLDEPVMADPSLLQEVFAAMRSELTYGLNSIRIDWLNGAPADTPVNRALLSDYGYVVQEGACVLDLSTP